MKIIMIGHGMVGHKFIESVLEHVGDDVEITILAEEPRLAYDRVHLTEYFSGKSAKDLTLCRAFCGCLWHRFTFKHQSGCN